MSKQKEYLSSRYSNYLAPEAIVWVNNTKLSKEWLYFTNLEVNKSLDGADIFSFTISDAIDLEFESKHHNLFELGKEVEIHIGYADSHKNKSELSMLFKGRITKVNWEFSENNYLDITIEGSDNSFLLMKKPYKESIRDVSISEAVKRIISKKYNSIFKKIFIEQTEVKYKQIENQEQNDYLFIKSLAKKCGYEFFVDGDSLYFRSPPQRQKSLLTLLYGQEILGFKPELNVEKEVSKVKVVGLEMSSDKKPIVGEATCRDTSVGMKAILKKLDEVEHVVKEPVKSAKEAQERAEAILQELTISSSLKGEVKSIGIPDLRPGITISLQGLGKRFSSDYYIQKAVHSFGEQGYETTIEVRRVKRC